LTPAAVLLAGLLQSCYVVQRPAPRGAPDHAYIDYWPAPEKTKTLTLAIKDNIDMKGVVTSAGSEYLAKNSPPASRDAACLAIARKRGVRIIGKTNLSEFALSPSGLNDYYGTPRQPFSKPWRRFIPGGSSSGSGAAAADGSADVTFGTDTAGSIRVPAACCGIVGLKTTFGLVSTKGVFPVEPLHLDTVGPMGRDVTHVVQGMDLLQGGFAARYKAAVAAKPSAEMIRIGRLYVAGTDPKIDQAVDEALARSNFKVIKLDQGLQAKWEQAKKDGNTVAAAGAWISDQDYTTKNSVLVRTKAVILLGRLLYPTQYRQALARREQWQLALDRAFKKVDFIALPTLQTPPPVIPFIGRIALLEARVLALQNTVPVNFAGNPALAVPIPLDVKDIPLSSVQLIGPKLSEAELLNAGRLIELKNPIAQTRIHH
jgi:Asp-tRNA(Asn)/Glu-tRNA(Gln) amidotransferase A subunit family amidase